MSTGKDVVICDTCQLDTGVKTVQCEKCLRNFHTKCTKFQPFTTTKGTNSRTCQFCINDMLSSSTGVKTRTGSTCSTGAPTRSAGPLPGDSALQTILAKLEALGKVTQATSLKVDAIDKRSESFEKVRFTAMEDRMSSMEAKLDQLPALALRISDIEARIEGVEAEQRAVRATLDSIDAGGSLGEIPPIVTRVGSMETAIRGLADGVAKINAERARLSSELLISGLNYDEGVDVRRLALAVFRAIMPDILEGDIVSARRLRVRGVTAGGNVVSGTSGSVPRSPSLVVTLSSGTIARSLVAAKARHRKLHSSDLSAELLGEAGAALPPIPSLINVNEFLPADLHILRSSVRDVARRNGFATFVRDGEVFIRRKKEDIATRISSADDLKNFLLPYEIFPPYRHLGPP